MAIEELWKVLEEHMGGEPVYMVYRLRDADIPDRRGNREYYGKVIHNDKEKAECIAGLLNASG